MVLLLVALSFAKFARIAYSGLGLFVCWLVGMRFACMSHVSPCSFVFRVLGWFGLELLVGSVARVHEIAPFWW